MARPAAHRDDIRLVQIVYAARVLHVETLAPSLTKGNDNRMNHMCIGKNSDDYSCKLYAKDCAQQDVLLSRSCNGQVSVTMARKKSAQPS